MPESLPDIIYKTISQIPCIDSPNSMYMIPYYKEDDYFDSIESRVKFINACERAIRGSDSYSKYKRYIMTVVGLDHSQVIPGVTLAEDSKDSLLEMHHGPILTLFDICDIVIEYFLIKKWKITTFRIADYVLEQHWKNRVQVVMLDPTSHQEVHDRGIFLNYKMGFGDLAGFIEHHRKAITSMYEDKIDRYIDRSMQYDSNDFGILTLNKALWGKK